MKIVVPNKTHALDAARTSSLHSEGHRRRASDARRWAVQHFAALATIDTLNRAGYCVR
jgi:hypothetical protein